MRRPDRPIPPLASPEVLRAAFDELHGPRLHGFALLLTMGDRERAARLAGAALAAAGSRTEALRHPERAAAWLRARVVRGAGGRTRPRAEAVPARTTILGSLGVDAATYAGLAALAPRERASIVAAVVERLDRRDVATIVGRDGAALDRLLVRARRRYMAAHAAAAGDAAPHGPLVERLAAEAARAMR